MDDEYRDYIQIYTDGSKDPESGRTGSAIIIYLFSHLADTFIQSDLQMRTVYSYSFIVI